MKNKIYFFLITLFLFSCNKNKELRYYENGNIMSDCPTHKGKKNGLCTTYTELGTVSSLISFYDDIEWGLAIQYYENENVKTISSWDYGVLEHQYLSFFPDGSIEETAYLRGGKFQGNRILFFEAGGIKMLRRYEEGRLDGESTLFYPNYQKKVSINYDGNIKSGNAFAFDSTGKMIEFCLFANDSIKGDIVFYDVANKNTDKSSLITQSIKLIEQY